MTGNSNPAAFRSDTQKTGKEMREFRALALCSPRILAQFTADDPFATPALPQCRKGLTRCGLALVVVTCNVKLIAVQLVAQSRVMGGLSHSSAPGLLPSSDINRSFVSSFLIFQRALECDPSSALAIGVIANKAHMNDEAILTRQEPKRPIYGASAHSASDESETPGRLRRQGERS